MFTFTWPRELILIIYFNMCIFSERHTHVGRTRMSFRPPSVLMDTQFSPTNVFLQGKVMIILDVVFGENRD